MGHLDSSHDTETLAFKSSPMGANGHLVADPLLLQTLYLLKVFGHKCYHISIRTDVYSWLVLKGLQTEVAQ